MKSEEFPLDDAELPEDAFLADADSASGGTAEDRGKVALQVYLREIAKIPLLKPHEERELALRAQAGDAEAERRMVEANLRLVLKIARGYVNRGLPLPDLIAEGNLGLLTAVRKFRPEKGTRLSTYATWWIRQAIARALANQARLIRLPVHVELLLSRYHRETKALTQRLGRPPSLEEVAQALDVPPEQLAELEGVRQHPISLETPVGNEGKEVLGDLVTDHAPALDNPLSVLLRERTDLAGILDGLPDSEQTVLRLRFGLAGDDPMTLEGIGRRIGVTRERVRQIETAGLKRLRALLASRGVDPADLFV